MEEMSMTEMETLDAVLRCLEHLSPDGQLRVLGVALMVICAPDFTTDNLMMDHASDTGMAMVH
jgi:hypothetical protein